MSAIGAISKKRKMELNADMNAKMKAWEKKEEQLFRSKPSENNYLVQEAVKHDKRVQ